jgi:putative membrane protein
MTEIKKTTDKVLSDLDRSALLRDHLAADRTIQANERTLLAYVRTALTMFVAGVSFIRFFGHDVYKILGVAFVPLSIIILLIGVWRYRHTAKVLAALARANGLLLHPPIPKD